MSKRKSFVIEVSNAQKREEIKNKQDVASSHYRSNTVFWRARVCAGNVQYWSVRIQDKLVDIFGHLAIAKIIDQVKSDFFFYRSGGLDNRHIETGTDGPRASTVGQQNFQIRVEFVELAAIEDFRG